MKMHRFESTERQSRGLCEAPPAGIVLGTNGTDFMGSFTMSPEISVDNEYDVTATSGCILQMKDSLQTALFSEQPFNLETSFN